MALGANNAVISEMQFKQKILQRAPAGLAGTLRRMVQLSARRNNQLNSIESPIEIMIILVSDLVLNQLTWSD